MATVQVPTFVFTETEIQRYRSSGVAIADVVTMVPEPLGRCRIDTTPLIAIAPPAFAWVEYTRRMPKIKLGSAHSTPPRSAKNLDQRLNLESIEFMIRHKHPSKDYDPIELEAKYRD